MVMKSRRGLDEAVSRTSESHEVSEHPWRRNPQKLNIQLEMGLEKYFLQMYAEFKNTKKSNVVTGFYKCGNEHSGSQKEETISF